MDEKTLYEDVIETIQNWHKAEFWKQCRVSKETINRSTELNHIMLDSLDILEIIVKMEEKYGREIKDSDIEVHTIGDIVDLISKSPRK